MSLYLMTEKTKNEVKNLIVQHSLNIVGSRRRSRSGGWSRPTPQHVYDGPFAVSKKDDTTVTVAAGSVIAGITETEVPESDVSVSSTGVLYLELTYDGGYSAELKTAVEMPALSAENYTEMIAEITVEDSKIKSISQMWEAGDIKVIGRLT